VTALPKPHPAEDLVVPPIGTGAPSLAKALHQTASLIADLQNAGDICLADDARAQIRHAIDLLKAIPMVPPATETVGDKTYWRDETGALLPANLVKSARLLEDGLVRTIAAGALAINASIARFKSLSFAEAQAMLATLAQDYNVTLGGKAGNVSFYSHDRAWKVQITVQERIGVNAGIEVAKALFNEWLKEADASDEVKAVVMGAFGLDDQGRVRVAELVRLRRFAIEHPKWRAGMQAIEEALERLDSKPYLRVYRRRDDGSYEHIALDLASV
jgi:hypothetical protein